MGTDDKEQRSGFQFELFKLNLIANGAIIAFSLENSDTWSKALFACPFISFVLFSLWVHHGIAIKMDSQARKRIKLVNVRTAIEANVSHFKPLRVITFSLAILANFCALPLGAITVFRLDENRTLVDLELKLNNIGIVLIGLIVILYLIWAIYQYELVKKKKSSDAE